MSHQSRKQVVFPSVLLRCVERAKVAMTRIVHPNCTWSHKPSHLEAAKKKLKKEGKPNGRRTGRGRGRGSHRRGRAGATVEDEAQDGGDDYIPYVDIEVNEGDEPVDDDK